jgi:Flp pilus assembly pilin Flp
MTLKNRISAYLLAFHRDESGAATIDWVVGTAMAVTLSLAVMDSVSDGLMALSDRVANTIASLEFDWSDPPPEENTP